MLDHMRVAAMTRNPITGPRLGAVALFAAPYCIIATSLAFAAIAGGSQPTFLDITLTVRSGMPVWESSKGLHKNWRTLFQSIADGDVVNQSWLNLDAHTGTHVDAPAHFLDGGSTVEQLDLGALIGPAYVIDVPPGSNITADTLKRLHLPRDAERILFKTENTAKGLLYRKEFVSDYIGLDSTAAKYLGDGTSIRLVGVDYLSVGMLEDIQETHKELFKANIVVVEGLDLQSVKPGQYNLICLPAKLSGSDGAPVRCVLQELLVASGPTARLPDSEAGHLEL